MKQKKTVGSLHVALENSAGFEGNNDALEN